MIYGGLQLRIRNMLGRDEREEARALLEGAFRGIAMLTSEREAAIKILKDLPPELWDCIPDKMANCIFKEFLNDHNNAVQSKNR